MFLDRTVPQISRNWERFEFVRDGKARLGAGIQRAIDAGLFPAGRIPRRLPDSRRGYPAPPSPVAPGED
jgi:hypothetical protein